MTKVLNLESEKTITAGQTYRRQSMKTRRVCFDLPLGSFSALRKSPTEFSREMRTAAAAKWYEMGIISQEKASEVAGMSREDFLMELARFNVSPFQYAAEEVLEEAGYK